MSEEIELDEGIENEAESSELEIPKIILDDDSSALSEEELEEKEALEKAPDWVKNVRKESEIKSRKIRELEQQLKEKQTQEEAKATPVLGKEPEMADEGIDYDEVVFKQKWKEWNAVGETIKQAEAKQKAEEAEANKVYLDRMNKYHEDKKKLNLPDYDVAEKAVLSSLNTTQQGIIIAYLDNPAKFAYALGTNDKALQNLAPITDPIQFALDAKELQNKMKQTTRQAPSPETKISGNATISAKGSDKKLEELRAKAEKTGNYSEVIAYRRKLKAQT